MKLVRSITSAILALGLALFAANGSWAATLDGTADTAFSAAIKAGNLGYGEVTSTAVLPNGKLLIGGNQTTGAPKLMRLNADGTVDSTFTAINFGTNNDNGRIVSIVPITGGAFYVAGYFPSVTIGSTTTPTTFLAKFSAAGAIDTAFSAALENSSTGFEHYAADNGSSAYAMTVDSSGRVLLAGGFTSRGVAPWAGTSIFPLMRINTNGSVDATYAPLMIDSSYNFGFNLVANADGSAYVVGGFGNGNPTLYKVNANGQTSTTFVTDPSINHSLYSVAVQTDGKVLVGGILDSDTSYLVRVNTDGTLDSTFVDPAFSNPGSYPSVNGILIADDGSILVGGSFPGNVKRLSSIGSEDAAFTAQVSAAGYNGYVDGLAWVSKSQILAYGIIGNASNGVDLFGPKTEAASNGGQESQGGLAETGSEGFAALMFGIGLVLMGSGVGVFWRRSLR
jgi:uncharacterized delta-60 repeat protein